MKVLIVSGIWPPDVGGPASHAPELAAFLLDRGHAIEVVTTAEAAPASEQYQVRWVSRAQPRGVRHARALAVIRDRAADADVVYATSMLGRAALGATLARRPIVVKLVADEAYERARRLGLFDGDLDEFQHYKGGARVRLLRQARDRTLRRVDALICPSAYLASRAVAWGIEEARVTVIPNAAPPLPAAARARRCARAIRRSRALRSRSQAGSRARRRSKSRSRRLPASTASRCSSPATGPTCRGPQGRLRARARRSRPLRRPARPGGRPRAFPRRRRLDPLVCRGRTSRTPSSRRSRSGRR